jgi:hypothetical protein
MLNTYIRLVCKTYPWPDASIIRQKIFQHWAWNLYAWNLTFFLDKNGLPYSRTWSKRGNDTSYLQMHHSVLSTSSFTNQWYQVAATQSVLVTSLKQRRINCAPHKYLRRYTRYVNTNTCPPLCPVSANTDASKRKQDGSTNFRKILQHQILRKCIVNSEVFTRIQKVRQTHGHSSFHGRSA